MWNRPPRGSRPRRRPFPVWDRLEDWTLLSLTPTMTAISASSPLVALGQSVTLTATVSVVPGNSGTPTGGTVTFYGPSQSQLGTVPLVNGTAVLPTTSLGLGANTLTASYSGDGASFAASATGTIATVAGAGGYFNGVDNVPATSAVLDSPFGVALDAAGDMFIADQGINRVREVVKATGLITTVAGTGTAGYNGDGIPATAAKLNSPTGVAVDAAGDVFIADQNNNRVREVAKATGLITTVAGTGTTGSSADGMPATATRLKNPFGVAVDAAGDVFFSDETDNRIREVVKATGLITTVAGTGVQGYNGDGIPATAAQLNSPAGIAVDAAGDVFFADPYNQRVREVVRATGQILTVAGTGVYGYNGDNIAATAAQIGAPFGVAVDAAGDVFIADSSNLRVREVVKATGLIATVAGTGVYGYNGDGIPATAAQLYGPQGVAVDATGDVFIADTYNHRIREVTSAAVVNVVAANSATFLGPDTTTSGAWKGSYGGDGYTLAGDAQNLPSYATVTLTSDGSFVWDPSSANQPALQKADAGSTDRAAACWYGTNSVAADIHLTDGKVHQVAAYLLDWDGNNGRSETVQVVDDATGTVLDTRTVTGYSGGTYLVWNLSGNVTLWFTNNGGPTSPNAVLSGLFFGGPVATSGSASFVTTDTTTTGYWKGVYGAGGFDLAGDPSANNPSLPSYATLTLASDGSTVWNPSSANQPALQKAAAGSTDRVAACWYGTNSVAADIHLTDGKVHQVAAYLLDYDGSNGRSENVQVLDDATGTVLDSRTVSGFSGGKYVVWNLSGNVTLRFTNNGGPNSPNAVLSGLFFGTATPPVGSASFVTTDTTTAGYWNRVYGAGGFDLAGDPSANNPSLPSYATVTMTGATSYVWNPSTTPLRALLKAAAGSNDGVAACWYGSSSFGVDVHLTDGQTHQVAAYLLDYDDSNGRSETVQVVDDATGTVLDTRTVTSFSGGKYLVWNISGNVTLRFLNNGGPTSPNAVLSGLFFNS
jgi:hypothetical protein